MENLMVDETRIGKTVARTTTMVSAWFLNYIVIAPVAPFGKGEFLVNRALFGWAYDIEAFRTILVSDVVAGLIAVAIVAITHIFWDFFIKKQVPVNIDSIMENPMEKFHFGARSVFYLVTMLAEGFFMVQRVALESSGSGPFDIIAQHGWVGLGLSSILMIFLNGAVGYLNANINQS